jgi:hypothetical protein
VAHVDDNDEWCDKDCRDNLNEIATYSEPELPNQVAYVLHVWRKYGFG